MNYTGTNRIVKSVPLVIFTPFDLLEGHLKAKQASLNSLYSNNDCLNLKKYSLAELYNHKQMKLFIPK